MLFVTARLGSGLYMFFVGIEFDRDVFRRQARSAAAVSVAGMVVPYALGAARAPWLLGMPGLFGDRVRAHEAVLLLGAAIAITAFLMLARIIYDARVDGDGAEDALTCGGGDG